MTTSACQLQQDNSRPSTLSLGDFFGQKPVVIFCPSEGKAARAELETCQARAEAFQRAGAWLVAVTRSGGEASPAGGKGHVKLAVDPGGLAFQIIAARFPEVTDSKDGIVFPVDRDGIARNSWAGFGRAGDVPAGVRERP